MKKIISLLLILLLVGAFAACTDTPEPVVPAPPTEPIDIAPPGLEPLPEPELPPSPERPVPGVTGANIRVQYVPDAVWDQFEDQPDFADLSQFDSYHELVTNYDSPYVRVVITTEQPLSQFRFVEVAQMGDDTWEALEMTILYSLDELTPEVPFVAQVAFLCFTSNRGIIFWDEAYGRDRFFVIHSSGYDGTLMLFEEEESEERWIFVRSPRTAVTGLLADPNRAWTDIIVSGDPGWDEVRQELVWTDIRVSQENAQTIHNILTTMDTMEVLTPFHNEGQHADSLFRILIQYGDETLETIYAGIGGGPFSFRFTDTFGNHGDPGYVTGRSDALLALLESYF